jgi:hypothetical protein
MSQRESLASLSPGTRLLKFTFVLAFIIFFEEISAYVASLNEM